MGETPAMIIQGMESTGPPAPVSPAISPVTAPMQKKPRLLCQNALPLPGRGGRRAHRPAKMMMPAKRATSGPAGSHALSSAPGQAARLPSM